MVFFSGGSIAVAESNKGHVSPQCSALNSASCASLSSLAMADRKVPREFSGAQDGPRAGYVGF